MFRTVIKNAVRDNDIEQLKSIIENEKDVKIKGYFGNSLMVEAVKKRRDKEIVKILLEHGASANSTAFAHETPFHLITEANVELMELLMQHGADINAENYNEFTPLNKAIYDSKDIGIIRFLIQQGADLNIKDISGRTALHNVFKVEFADSSIEQAKLLIEKGADIHAKDYKGRTPFHLACTSASTLEIVKLLIKLGVDPIGVENNNGSKPLHYAATGKNNFETVKLLLLKGADINEKNTKGQTPFMFACKTRSNVEMLTFLQQLGAYTNLKAEESYGTLHLAALTSNNIEIIEYLLENEFDVNELNKDKKTALQEATIHLNTENMKVLLLNGAKVDFVKGFRVQTSRFGWLRPGILLVKNIICQHLIRMKFLGLVDNVIFESWNSSQTDELKNFEEECKMEAGNLDDLICLDRNVRFVDLLIKSEYEVAVFLNTDEIEDKLCKINFLERFPIYFNLLQTKIKKCSGLAKLLKNGYKLLQIVLNNFQLPDVVLHKIISFFSRQDLKSMFQIKEVYEGQEQ